MAAMSSMTIPLIDCPVCGQSITAYASTRVVLDKAPAFPAEKVATAKVTLEGIRVQHDCIKSTPRGVQA